MKRVLSVCLLLLCLNCFSQRLNVDSLKGELTRAKEDTNKVILLRILCGTLLRTDADAAVQYAKSGIELGKKLNYDRGVAGCYLNLAASYAASNKMGIALKTLDTTIQYSIAVGEAPRIALAYLNRADIHMQLRNFNQSLRDCDTSFKYAELANSDDRRARVLQTIGSVYYHQNMYDKCASYYDRAYALYQKVGNRQMSAIILSNLGNVYKHMGKYDLAINSLNAALKIADSIHDVANLAMYHGNISDLYLLAGKPDLAEQSANRSMEFALEVKRNIQVAMAYVHYAEIYLHQKRFQKSIEAANQAYAIAKEEEDVPLQQAITDILAEAHSGSGSFDNAFRYMKTSKQLSDSLNKQQFDEEVASLQTGFEVNEKDREIQLLAKDKQLSQQQLQQQKAYLFGIGALVLLVLAGTVFIINRNKLRQKMKELELRNRIAADLHDEVGSSLSSIHMLSQVASQRYSPDATQDEILTRVSTNARETMEKMSDIVWMIKPGENEAASLIQRMKRFMYEMCGSCNMNCNMHGEEVLEKAHFSMQQRRNIYLIFKEALNNAVKYSDAKTIGVNFQLQGHQMMLTVTDDGKGFVVKDSVDGNGLVNMENRAKELNGTLLITSVLTSGTSVRLTIPV